VSAAWIRHTATNAVIEVPASAVPFHVQSGWIPLTEQEVADMRARQLNERNEAEVAMGKTVRTVAAPHPEQSEQPEQLEQPEKSERPSTAPEREQPKPASARPKSGSSKENN
jgi:hypothetical protein